MRKLLLSATACRYGLLCYILTFMTSLVAAKVITVSPKGPIKTIQEGIDRTHLGDTLFIKKGIYPEYGLLVSHPIHIMGEKDAIIIGQLKGEILRIESDHVWVEGLTFRNVGISSLNDWAAILIHQCSDVQIIRNKVENAFFGIYISDSHQVVVQDNWILGVVKSEHHSGNGIHAWQCDSLLISKNIIQQHRDGIYFEFVTNSKVIDNQSTDNSRYGLHFMFSHADDYIGNLFRKNGAGVAVMYSKYVNMFRNTFEQNWGSAAYGLLLKDIKEGTLSENHFQVNTVGILMEGANELKIHHNLFKQNGWGIRIQANCEANSITNNNFEGNTFDITTNGQTVLNVFEQNYWDKYEGYDLNKDQLGDVPYHPVSLFAMIVEKMPYGIILLRSFMVGLLDRAEKIIPTLTPIQLVDPQPSMKPYNI